MIESVKFQSQHYQALHFKNILSNQLSVNSEGLQQLLSNQSMVLFPSSLRLTGNIKLITPAGAFLMHSTLFERIDNTFLSESGMVLARFESSSFQKTPMNLDYLCLCQGILRESMQAIDGLVAYVHEHLSGRLAGDRALTQHESIQFLFANVVCRLATTRSLIASSVDLTALWVSADELIEATHGLSKLGGGRSFLRGNSLELLFHLRFFQSLFLRGYSK